MRSRGRVLIALLWEILKNTILKWVLNVQSKIGNEALVNNQIKYYNRLHNINYIRNIVTFIGLIALFYIFFYKSTFYYFFVKWATQNEIYNIFYYNIYIILKLNLKKYSQEQQSTAQRDLFHIIFLRQTFCLAK